MSVETAGLCVADYPATLDHDGVEAELERLEGVELGEEYRRRVQAFLSRIRPEQPGV